ncbi:MAG: sigma 54-interacting transcriptional regulator [Spirochaetaceae bacterium]|jgi:Nif-specific regulatory protein|nr:sigma 54-interacting transcriptional regulator [Spirochaetaceae bacterium]
MLSTIDIQKFNTMVEINNRINSNYVDVHVLLTQILDSATRLSESESSILLLVNEKTRALYVEAALGIDGLDTKKATVKIGEGIAGWVVQHNKALLINDAENDNRRLQSIEQQTGCSFRTILAVPLRIKDRCGGVIELLNKKNGKDFTQDDLEWLTIFANQAAITIQNAQSFEKPQGDVQMFQDRLTGPGYHPFIAKSPAILSMIDLIDRIAKTDSSVLIMGESGVGKELFAEQVHIRSARNTQPFVRVNCAALPEGLLESELFGHVKGAFTDAVQSRRGRFEMADGGTLFLDEIGDLPLPIQAKLLRVIQERTFEKVGSDESITVDARILAATNRDIEDMVERGEFRSDLYYRLNVLLLYVPPLRQRPEDIPELVNFFFLQACKKNKKQFKGFSNEAMESLLAYSWPGNVRELENCVERACIIGNGEWIRREDLFLNSDSFSSVQTGEGSRNLKNAVTAFKAHFIQKVLEENNWNQTETAKVLDIQRTYLSRLIKELGLSKHQGENRHGEDGREGRKTEHQ